MQMDDAAWLRQTKKPCPDGQHKWEREYFNGANTGDYVCSVCGAEISGWALERQKNKLDK